MKKPMLLCITAAFLLPSLAQALPRDAAAVLNRCGNPLHGDETILENTVAGGRRLLRYERGTLSFDKVRNDGWTFTTGTHGDNTALNASQMSVYMPCLRDALSDSAASAPLPQFTALNRAEVSAKRAYKSLIAYSFLLLGILGAFFILLSRRPQHNEDLVG